MGIEILKKENKRISDTDLIYILYNNKIYIRGKRSVVMLSQEPKGSKLIDQYNNTVGEVPDNKESLMKEEFYDSMFRTEEQIHFEKEVIKDMDDLYSGKIKEEKHDPPIIDRRKKYDKNNRSK